MHDSRMLTRARTSLHHYNHRHMESPTLINCLFTIQLLSWSSDDGQWAFYHYGHFFVSAERMPHPWPYVIWWEYVTKSLVRKFNIPFNFGIVTYFMRKIGSSGNSWVSKCDIIFAAFRGTFGNANRTILFGLQYSVIVWEILRNWVERGLKNCCWKRTFWSACSPTNC